MPPRLQWYEMVPSGAELEQGDLIVDCPTVSYANKPVRIREGQHAFETLREAAEVSVVDLVVMTQSCDLQQDKIRQVILCPHYSLQVFKDVWEEEQRRKGQNPTAKAWSKYLDGVADGRVYNLAILNKENGEDYAIEHRIVDFREVLSLPRDFLESWIAQQNGKRLRLLPPYREHLAQAFARFFMRVGLPTEIEKTWNQN